MPRQYTPRVLCVCLNCEQQFETWPSALRKGGGKYCSVACYRQIAQPPSRYQSGKIEIACDACGTPFLTWPYRARDGQRFCSPACAHPSKHRGQRCACAVCGTTYYVPGPRLAKGQGRYCSNACKGVGTRLDKHNGRNGWLYAQWRKAVYDRDGYACQDCGQRGITLTAHHINPWHTHPAQRLEVANGVTLCWPCHRTRHWS